MDIAVVGTEEATDIPARTEVMGITEVEDGVCRSPTLAMEATTFSRTGMSHKHHMTKTSGTETVHTILCRISTRARCGLIKATAIREQVRQQVFTIRDQVTSHLGRLQNVQPVQPLDSLLELGGC